MSCRGMYNAMKDRHGHSSFAFLITKAPQPQPRKKVQLQKKTKARQPKCTRAHLEPRLISKISFSPDFQRIIQHWSLRLRSWLEQSALKTIPLLRRTYTNHAKHFLKWFSRLFWGECTENFKSHSLWQSQPSSSYVIGFSFSNPCNCNLMWFFSLFQLLLYFSPATCNLIIFLLLNLLNRPHSQGGADLPSIEVFIALDRHLSRSMFITSLSPFFSSPTVLPPMTIIFPALPSPSHWSSRSLLPHQRGRQKNKNIFHQFIITGINGDQTLMLFVLMYYGLTFCGTVLSTFPRTLLWPLSEEFNAS